MGIDAERGETPTEKLDRNWSDLLQELRVAQTGVQLLTGLLFTAVFQPRFVELPRHGQIIYLVTVSLSTLATALLIAPVAMHRVLFRRHARARLVSTAQRFTLAGLGMLALAVSGMLYLIFEVVVSGPAAAMAAGVSLAVFGGLWAFMPLVYRRRIAED